MANLVVITGPIAVGKMTVAEALKEKIGYNLMVNHDSIEVSDRIFGFATPAQKEFNKLIRMAAFDTAVKYNESMIFTIKVDFNDNNELDYLNEIKAKFEKTGGTFYFVELSASVDIRLKRNITPNRLEKKKSKQDLEWSRRNLLTSQEKYRMNTNENEYWFKNHIKINNENLSPDEVAQMIIDKFNLIAEFKENKSNNKMY
ncbi:MAG: shikimate kinase [Eubacterium sp.]